MERCGRTEAPRVHTHVGQLGKLARRSLVSSCSGTLSSPPLSQLNGVQAQQPPFPLILLAHPPGVLWLAGAWLLYQGTGDSGCGDGGGVLRTGPAFRTAIELVHSRKREAWSTHVVGVAGKRIDAQRLRFWHSSAISRKTTCGLVVLARHFGSRCD